MFAYKVFFWKKLPSADFGRESTVYNSYFTISATAAEPRHAACQLKSHARTVVRECCKGDDESQWERVKFDPPPPKNPLTDGHQNLRT